MKKVGVTGANGFIGRAVVAALRKRGDYVRALVRNPDGAKFPAGVEARHFDTMQPNAANPFNDLDAVIHLAGESVAGSWTADKKKKIHATRQLGTRNVVNAMQSCERPPKVLLSASASGYYGDRGDEPLEESAGPGSDFLAAVCVDWEAEAKRAENFGARVVCLRQGLVWGPGGGALVAMLPVFKWGAGGPLGSGRQWWPWIHLDDTAALFLFALDHPEISGPLNAVSPDVATNARFARALGHAIGRPSLAPAPTIALKLLLGEFASSLLASQLMLPAKAEDNGFVWQHESLEQALIDIFHAKRKPALGHFESSETVAADLHSVFRFFSDPSNLGKITPPAQDFEMASPVPSEMRRGSVIEHKLKVRGFPIRWKSLIVRWRPEEEFMDVQLRGPYQLWRHRHSFSPHNGGVVINDSVDYSLPLAPLSSVALPLVRHDLEEIFNYRTRRIAELLSGDRS